MSLTLDVNAFLNKDVCDRRCDDMAIEKEMETNIFDEIENLLKFNKNLEYEQMGKDEEPKEKKIEERRQPETMQLDFLNTTSDDFLLTSDSQSILGEDTLLFSVEKDKLLPISSRFMVPGIYKRIEGVATNESKQLECKKSNVFISELERQGRIVKQKDFESLYIMAEDCKELLIRKVLLVESMESDNEEGEVMAIGQESKDSNGEDKNKIPKEWDALNRLAYDILKLTNRDHIVIDRKKNEIIRTQFDTQQKTIYKFLAPEMLGLKPCHQDQNTKIINLEEEIVNTVPQTSKNKLGRPSKKTKKDTLSKKSSKINNKQIEKVTTSLADNKLQSFTNSNLRTRSGRLIKTPTTVVETQALPIELPPASPQESITNLLNYLKDSDYHGPKLDSKQPTIESKHPAEEFPTDVIQSPSKRKVPPEAICPTCNKIFLGRRLQRHFTQHPDHMKIQMHPLTPQILTNNMENPYTNLAPPSEDMSLFRFLISKLQKSQNLNEDQKADLFLNELNDLVEQLQLRSSRLVRNTSGLHFVNQRCSKLLGIPEGQYALDLSAIEAPVDPDLSAQYENSYLQTHHHHHHSQPNNINSRSLDYTNLSITIDDTLTDEAAQKLNLSAGGKLLPPSEESLLRAVDDLVQTDLDKIHKSSLLQPVITNTLSSSSSTSTVVAMPPHIDHASDNAVEAVHMKETSSNVNPSENPLLDLPVDFFQFNN